MVEIEFLGGVRSVTGSKFLVRGQDVEILVECGQYQGLKELRLRNWDPFPIDPREVDAAVITHAHLDHCGLLPKFVREGFQGPIHCTSDTAKLAAIVLADAAKMQREDADYAARKGYSQHKVPLPLFDEGDAERAIDALTPHPFHQRIKIAPESFLTFHRAGHILGSAVVELEVEGKRILFSGDLGRKNHPLLADPDRIPNGKFDAILAESTYGDRSHQSPTSSGNVNEDGLAAVIRRTIKRGGNVVIPAFAVDRTEVILHRLKELIETQSIPRTPIYVDSPMALRSLVVYREAFESDALDIDLKIAFEGDPFDTDFYNTAQSVDESKAIAALTTPTIIVSASGMASGGRVLHHLRRLLPDPRNTVILVGYQSVGTRGRLLADGVKELKLFGSVIKVNAEIAMIHEFSVHADSSEMIQWLSTAESAPGQLFIVHGEAEAGTLFQQTINISLGWDSTIPNRNQRYQI
jgi:metallo-beta-lactamase family protein